MRVSLDDAKEWLEELRHIETAVMMKAYPIALDRIQRMMNDIEDELEQGDPDREEDGFAETRAQLNELAQAAEGSHRQVLK